MTRTRHIFLDTEFLNRGADHPLSLISIGMVDDEGNEFYAINADAPLGAMWRDEFIRDVIWPQLPLPEVTHYGIAGSIIEWDATNTESQHLLIQPDLRRAVLDFLTLPVGPGIDQIQLWGDYCAFDMVLLSQLFGPFKDVPLVLPMHINDLQQLRQILGEPIWQRMLDAEKMNATAPLVEHHALADATTVKQRYDWLMDHDWLMDQPDTSSDYAQIYNDGMIP